MNVAAIMPCRGRAEQTVRNVRRLLATAGAVDWRLYCVMAVETAGMDAHSALARELRAVIPNDQIFVYPISRLTYWQALERVTKHVDAPLLCNLANDLLPGQHWLQRAVAAFELEFGDGPGLLGFNDGHHQVEHSCHFLISRSLLDDYGGWPVWYDHNYGDTELCQRAIGDGLYAKAPWATLYHDHPYFGGADDTVYAEGRAQSEQDRQTYERRRAAGWPTVR